MPLIPPRVVRVPAFISGTLFAALCFASFTSIFFSLAITWQDGFGNSALAAGLVISPFAVCSPLLVAGLSTASARRSPSTSL